MKSNFWKKLFGNDETRVQNNSQEIFIKAFERRLRVTPCEYINRKMKTGSDIDAIKYLFNIMASEISKQNNCKFYDFDYFYNILCLHRTTSRLAVARTVEGEK